MTTYELLKVNRGLINTLHAAGVRIDDVKYIDLYMDVKMMTDAGDKKTYAVAMAADRYKVSERLVYDIIRRFDTPLQI